MFKDSCYKTLSKTSFEFYTNWNFKHFYVKENNVKIHLLSLMVYDSTVRHSALSFFLFVFSFF